MFIIRIISIIITLIALIIILLNLFLAKKNNNKPRKIKKSKHKFCILIPARDESNVIDDLLVSIKNQTFKINMKDVYVIVESKRDKTVDICKKYDATVIYRKDVNLQRKGYALNDAVLEILNDGKHYDAYFIFDADNVLDKDFIKNMIPVYDKGYDLASGYRNCKNGNDSVIAASSSLTFSLINTIFNDTKTKHTKNITFSGTGFYIKGSIIEGLKGYPFHSLTEDYELSVYSTINNLTTYYNKMSIFYDEQPVKYKDTINQRQRWIRGYFDVRRMHFKKIHKRLSFKDKNFASKFDLKVGVIPYALILVAIIIYLLGLILTLNITELLTILIAIYFILMLITFKMILLEKDSININNKTKLKTLFYNPIFIISYIPCAVKALTKKEVKWNKVSHGVKDSK